MATNRIINITPPQRTASQAEPKTQKGAPTVTDRDLKGIKLRKVEFLSPNTRGRKALAGVTALVHGLDVMIGGLLIDLVHEG